MGDDLHAEIFKLLVRYETSYAKPMNSQEIGALLKVTPSYIRSQLSQFVKTKLVGVRRGNGGGYYLITEERQQNATS
jgi:DNA-binding IscR family transcriptional regulator